MTYAERSIQLALNSSILVSVLLGDAPGDCEFIPVRPVPANDEMWEELKRRWAGHGLRSVGLLGLVGTRAQYALKEPLDPLQMDALAEAFGMYVSTLLGDSIADQIERQKGDSVAWCERLYALHDPRN